MYTENCNVSVITNGLNIGTRNITEPEEIYSTPQSSADTEQESEIRIIRKKSNRTQSLREQTIYISSRNPKKRRS